MKNFLNTNWEVRLKNPVFWGQVLLAVLVTILSYFGLKAEDMYSWAILGQTLLDAVKNPYVIALVIVSVWNAINDPTTAGVTDSKTALTYSKPKKDEEDN